MILPKIRLNRFKNSFLNQTCYIFGDGGSQKFIDLKYFKDRPSICCGKIFFRNDFKNINPIIYAVPEPFLFAPDFLKREK